VDIVPPMNFWTLCPLGARDYNYRRDAFALPATPPSTVQLGGNCRAVLLNARLRPGAELTQVTLEALSQEVVIGLMGVTVMMSGKPFAETPAQTAATPLRQGLAGRLSAAPEERGNGLA